jgi:hypothetical protein
MARALFMPLGTQRQIGLKLAPKSASNLVGYSKDGGSITKQDTYWFRS